MFESALPPGLAELERALAGSLALEACYAGLRGQVMDEISEFEAKTNLSSLLDQVEQGRDIVITRAGRPVARLVAPLGDSQAKEAAKELRAIRASIAARGESLTIEEILSFRDEGRR